MYTGREDEGHTLDEGLGVGAGSVTVTVGCCEEAGAILCVVMTVNTADQEGEFSIWKDKRDAYGGPGDAGMLGGSVVRGPLTELPGIFEGRPGERAEVPDGVRVS